MPSSILKRCIVLVMIIVSLPALAITAPDVLKTQKHLQWPLHFERNQGQFPADWTFAARGPQALFAIRQNDLLLTLPSAGSHMESHASAARTDAARQFSLQFVGGRSLSSLSGEQPARTRINYFLGNDSERWLTGIPTFGQVRVREVYPGIDLLVYGNPRDVEFDWLISAGADPCLVRWFITDGTGRPVPASLSEGGDLLWQTSAEAIRQKAPLAWQIISGSRRAVEARFALNEDFSAGFVLGSYDPALPLIIDPVLVYSTYFGGTDVDQANAIELDSDGNIYFAGETYSEDLPTSPLNTDPFFGNAYIAKLTPEGDDVEFVTIFGGDDTDTVSDMVLSSDSVYVAGSTYSTDFPTTNALQPVKRADLEGYVFRLSLDGTQILNSTYFGSDTPDTGEFSADDSILSIDVEPDLNNVFIAGFTTGSDLWVMNPIQGNQDGPDGFVAVLGNGGSSLVFSTYLGGSGIDEARAIRYDFDQIYVAGSTNSGTDPGRFPLVNQTQDTYGGGDSDAFVAMIEISPPQLRLSTFLGGSGADMANDIEATLFKEALVVGDTASADFPRTFTHFPEPFWPSLNGFYTIISGPTNSFIWRSDTFGGSGFDRCLRVGVNFTGEFTQAYYFLGWSNSTDFPVVNPYQRFLGDTNPTLATGDATLFKLANDGSKLEYSTYLGGEGTDIPMDFALPVETSGVYLSGLTNSLDFPTVFPFQADKKSPQDITTDAFISVFSEFPNVEVYTPPFLTNAILVDSNFNNIGEAGEVLILQFSRAIQINPDVITPERFYLPVEGDSLGDSISFEINEFNARQLLITLGPNAHLSVLGEVDPFDPMVTSSGIDVSADLPPTAILSLAGFSALNSGDPFFNDTAIDLKVVFFPVTVNIGAPSDLPIVVAPAPSGDSALTRTQLVFAPNTVSNANVTLRPSGIDPRVPYAVQVEIDIQDFTVVDPMTLYIEYLEGEDDNDQGFVERGLQIYQYTPVGPGDFLWLSPNEEQQINVHLNTLIVRINQIDPTIPIAAGARSEGPGSSVGIFGNIPGETIESNTLFIKPIPGASVKLSLVTSPAIRPGSGGFYKFHEVEFPGYDQTTPDDPNRIQVSIRKPNLFDLGVLGDVQAFPLDSSAIMVIETKNADGAPIMFPDPVNMTVQFYDGTAGTFNDIVMFNGVPGDVMSMALVNDLTSGFGINFAFNAIPGMVTPFSGGGTVKALGVPNVTDSSGEGLWGVVATQPTPNLPDTWILR